jgi:hypothetical protein
VRLKSEGMAAFLRGIPVARLAVKRPENIMIFDTKRCVCVCVCVCVCGCKCGFLSPVGVLYVCKVLSTGLGYHIVSLAGKQLTVFLLCFAIVTNIHVLILFHVYVQAHHANGVCSMASLHVRKAACRQAHAFARAQEIVGSSFPNLEDHGGCFMYGCVCMCMCVCVQQCVSVRACITVSLEGCHAALRMHAVPMICPHILFNIFAFAGQFI